MKTILFVAAAMLACGVMIGCGGGDAKSPSNPAPTDGDATPAPGGTPGGGGAAASGSCADKTNDAFSKCASEIYGGKRYSEVITTCKAAINNTSHTESEKTYATGVCLGLVPSALFLSGHPVEAGDLLAVACKGSTDELRTNTAARATLITMLGMGKGEGNGDKIKSAVITFAGACDVEPGKVADRAIELSKQ